ncbi:MAG: ABC transporter permease [Deltaproteobacteria bacterium]|nr:ABC transporter permease [Deltaproteobacteria bacterium]
MRMLLFVAFRNLLQSRRRSLLLGVALGMVSLLLVLMLALSQGLHDNIFESAMVLSSGHVNIGGFYKAKPQDAFPLVTDCKKIRKLVHDEVKGVARIIDRGRGWAKLISESSSMQTGIHGIDVDEEAALLATLQPALEREYVDGGRAVVLGDLKRLREPNTLMLFAGQAKRLRVGVGDSLTLTAESFGGVTNTVDLQIVAVMKDVGFMSNWSVFVPKKVLTELYQLADDTTGWILLYLDNLDERAAVITRLRAVLTQAGYTFMEPESNPFWMKFETVAGEDWVGQKIDLTTWEDETSFLKFVTQALDSISFFLIAILLVIIVIGIMNAMWIAVRERTQEIGTLRAIGMQRRRVWVLFELEAMLLGLAATTVGTVAGVLLARAVNGLEIEVGIEALRVILMSDTLRLSVTFGQLVGPIIVFTLVAMLAALWPAVRASRLPPVTAIQRLL